jgi:beta-glucosidase
MTAAPLVLSVFLSADVPAQSTAGGDEMENRVEALLARMTFEEKIELLGGYHRFDLRGAPRIGLPRMHTADGPFGVRRESRTTVIPGGIALAATWNTDLAQRLGKEVGRDARARGVHFYLAPGVNIYRAPQSGRNFEYFGEDPYLAARMSSSYIRGVQSQGVAATVKHFFGNNSEFARHTTETIVDERTAREIYLPAFEAAVKDAKVGAVMGAYNPVNGEHMSQNRYYNVELLKSEWGFDGVLMSDWDATYDTAGAANGGLDLEMPSGKFLNVGALKPLIADGTVTQATIDDKVRRILRTAVRFGWLDRPQQDQTIPVDNAQGAAVALQTAREAVVLLKNANGLLPLDRARIRSIAVIGPNGHPGALLGGGSATVAPFRSTSLLDGLGKVLGGDVAVHHSSGVADRERLARSTAFHTSSDGKTPGLNVQEYDNLDLSDPPASTRVDPYIDQRDPPNLMPFITGEGEPDLDVAALFTSKPVSTRWTGYFTPAELGTFDVFVQLGGFARKMGYRLFIDHVLVADRWDIKRAPVETYPLELDATPHKIVLEHRTVAGGLDGLVPNVRLGIVEQGKWTDGEAEALAARVDAVVLAVGFDAESETEDWDRTFQLPPGQDELIGKITAANPNTCVVITSGGATDMTGWIDRVPAILQAWFLGQEGGTAIAEVLAGDVNPSGRLPATFERRWQDNPVHGSYYPPAGSRRVEYSEGVFVGYRGYEQSGVQPLFPFGHGLSYSDFGYSDLSISEVDPSPGTLFEVSFTVTNEGERAGSAVPQLYVSDPEAGVPRPPKELKGFAKIELQPGESRRVTLPLDARAFAFYDAEAGKWTAEQGEYEISVGESSARIALTGSLGLGRAITR